MAKYILYVIILANHKNNYTIGPLITDKDGFAFLTKKQIEDEIENNITTYIMDYSSRLPDCKNEIEVKIYDKKILEERVTLLSKLYPSEATKLSKLLIDANNNLKNDFIERVTINEEIIIEIP